MNEKAESKKLKSEIKILAQKLEERPKENIDGMVKHPQQGNKYQEDSPCSTGATSDLSDLQEQIKQLQEENKGLIDQIGQVGRIDRGKSNRYKDLEKQASRELDRLVNDIDTSSSLESNLQSPLFSMSDGTEDNDNIHNGESDNITSLQREIEHLQDIIRDADSKKLSSTDDNTEIDKLRRKMKESKEMSADEIMTLQDEVRFLNEELNSVKIQGEGGGQQHSNGNNRNQNDQIGKLIDSVMAKDEEIRELRQEIAILKDQLAAAWICAL